MTVSKINTTKLKIVLTDTEVLCCFGTYEKLFNMSGIAKYVIKILLRDVAKDYQLLNYEKLTAKIHAGKNLGCIIILSASGNKRGNNKYTIIFADSESLIKCVLFIKTQRNEIQNKSLLYKTENSYCLLFESPHSREEMYPFKEFCKTFYSDILHYEYAKEYGNLIIADNAITKIAENFS